MLNLTLAPTIDNTYKDSYVEYLNFETCQNLYSKGIHEEVMSDLGEFLESLSRLLEIECDDYEQLFDLEMASRHLLTIHSLEPFWTNLQERECLLQHIAACERQRQQVATTLARALQLDDADMTISQLSACVAEPYASRLRHYRLKLHYIVAKTKQCSEENATYLRSALLLINKGLDACNVVAETYTTYRAYGASVVSKRGLIFSERV
jgi:hypothetical protein